MARPKKNQPKSAAIDQPVAEPVAHIDPEGPQAEQADAAASQPAGFLRPRSRTGKAASILASIAVVGLVLALGFNLVYASKVYPGVTADGVYLGGLSRTAAIAAIGQHLDDYDAQVIPLNYGTNTIALNPTKIGVKYDIAQAVDQALGYGRAGSWRRRLLDQTKALWGKPVNFSSVDFSDAKLTPYLSQIDDDVNRPVTNASFDFSGGGTHVNPSVIGQRLDRGLLTLAIEQRLAQTSAGL
jgi:hypothetical protein